MHYLLCGLRSRQRGTGLVHHVCCWLLFSLICVELHVVRRGLVPKQLGSKHMRQLPIGPIFDIDISKLGMFKLCRGNHAGCRRRNQLHHLPGGELLCFDGALVRDQRMRHREVCGGIGNGLHLMFCFLVSSKLRPRNMPDMHARQLLPFNWPLCDDYMSSGKCLRH